MSVLSSADLTPPIPNSSVPRDPNEALRYAHRLEQRHYRDQDRIIGMDRKLAVAEAEMRELVDTLGLNKRLAVALAAVQSARDLLF